LRAALDSSPLWGGGRVEDTINLVGHALRMVLGVIARQQGWGLAEGIRVLAERAGTPELGGSSLKAALDLDWDDPAALQTALGVVLEGVERVRRLAEVEPGGDHPRVGWGLRPPGRSKTRTPPLTSMAGRASAREWQEIGGSRSAIRRYAMGARPAACGWTATSGTCCATSIMG
jgi:hypothetical protein